MRGNALRRVVAGLILIYAIMFASTSYLITDGVSSCPQNASLGRFRNILLFFEAIFTIVFFIGLLIVTWRLRRHERDGYICYSYHPCIVSVYFLFYTSCVLWCHRYGLLPEMRALLIAAIGIPVTMGVAYGKSREIREQNTVLYVILSTWLTRDLMAHT
jgi:hypothetical protein